MRRELETGLWWLLLGHAGGNPGYGQGAACGSPRQFPTLPGTLTLRMSLSPGARLGPYEIVALIGTGGMGEVYRARDTNLARDVAVKVLPDAFALEPDRLARFRREAQVLASLNHPHIAAIYGLEESSNGACGLVLELVEGLTLADRLVHGALPLDEVWPIGRPNCGGVGG